MKESEFEIKFVCIISKKMLRELILCLYNINVLLSEKGTIQKNTTYSKEEFSPPPQKALIFMCFRESQMENN